MTISKCFYWKFAVYLGSTDICSQRGGLLNVASKMNYLRKIKECLMKMVADHLAWSDASTDKIGWWSQLCCRAEKAMKCNNSFDALQTWHLYCHIKESADWYPIDLQDDNSKYPQNLHGIIVTLFEGSTPFREYNNTAGPMQNCFKVITDFQAAGHGGKIKFLCWNETQWDLFLKTPQLIWREVKTLLQYRMY